MIYNYQIHKLGLQQKYPLIQEGDKIKFIKLKEANPFKFDVISYMTNLPPEFKLQQYIDYDIHLNNNWSKKIINAYQHFRSMPSNNCVEFLKDRKDWFYLVDKVVNKPMEFATDRLLLYKKINNLITQKAYNKFPEKFCIFSC